MISFLGTVETGLYGLPKVHKAGCPFRPIVSSVSTYNYNLASYLVGVLQPISTNQHSVKDSFSFADWAKQYRHSNGFYLMDHLCAVCDFSHKICNINSGL